MKKLIKNLWQCESGENFLRARILNHQSCPEGLDVERIRFFENGTFFPHMRGGHIISVISGSGELTFSNDGKQRYRLQKGVHCFLPAGSSAKINATSNTELVCVSSPKESQSRGKKFLIRNERFLHACALEANSLRWILTPQYLSRRIFLHHDPVLVSKSQHPVSWFHTTMFDVSGLPENQDGQPVFKMSYNSRTEFNCCYDVKGTARVRMAIHPYSKQGQAWGPWMELDGNSTYHLNESDGCPEEERWFDNKSQTLQTLRNKHEVSIWNGHVSLFCLFDPSPSGIERHLSGEYTDYPPLSQVSTTPEYARHQKELARFDEMLDLLSEAEALGVLEDCRNTPAWSLYSQGREAQLAIESELYRELADEGRERHRIIARWLSSDTFPENRPLPMYQDCPVNQDFQR